MADPTPVRPKITPAPRKTPAADASAKESALPPLRVNYYRQMKPQRVYTVTVGWHRRRKEPLPAAAQGVPVAVRLLMAGAQVLPSEGRLDPSSPSDRATFYVTPLARGWLRAERLEILVGGRKVQEVRLPAKVVTQRTTWVLLLLTLLVPWFLLTYFKYSPLRESVNTPGKSLQSRIFANVPEFPEVVEEKAPAVADWIETIPRELGNFYDVAHIYAQEEPLAFYAGLTLLVLTLLSWCLHRERRRRVRTAPLPLPVREPAESPGTVRRGAAATTEAAE